MAYDKRKIANSFYLPKYPFLSGVASLLDFRGSRSRRLAEQILSRSPEEAMRIDLEAVLANLDLSDESRAENAGNRSARLWTLPSKENSWGCCWGSFSLWL